MHPTPDLRNTTSSLPQLHPCKDLTDWLSASIQMTPALRSIPLYPGIGADIQASPHLSAETLWTVRLIRWAQQPGEISPQLNTLREACRYLTGTSLLHLTQQSLIQGCEEDVYELGNGFEDLKKQVQSYLKRKTESALKTLRGQPGTAPSLPHPTAFTLDTLNDLLKAKTQTQQPRFSDLMRPHLPLDPDVSHWTEHLQKVLTYSHEDKQHLGQAGLSRLWNGSAQITMNIWNPTNHDQAVEAMEEARLLELDYPQTARILRETAFGKLGKSKSARAIVTPVHKLGELLEVSDGHYQVSDIRRKTETLEELLRYVHLRQGELEDVTVVARACEELQNSLDFLSKITRTESGRDLIKARISSVSESNGQKLWTMITHMRETGLLIRRFPELELKQGAGMGLLALGLTSSPALPALRHLAPLRKQRSDKGAAVTLSHLRSVTDSWSALGGSSAAHTALLIRLQHLMQPNPDAEELLSALATRDPLQSGGTRRDLELLCALREVTAPPVYPAEDQQKRGRKKRAA